MWKRLIASGLALSLVSCALPRNVIVLVPDEGGTTGRVIVAKDGTEQDLQGSYGAADMATSAKPRPVFVADIKAVEAAFAGALAAKPRPPRIFILFFVLGQAKLEAGSVGLLTELQTVARAIPNADISVVGHSDAVGSDTQNMALSLQRAQMVRDLLVQGGVRESVVEIDYHGSNNPLVPTPRGVPQARNRRVEVTIR